MSESHKTHSPPSFRQLNHDIGNDLAVLSMSLRAISGVCDDAELFAEVTQTMQENLDSLKVKVKALMEFWCHPFHAGLNYPIANQVSLG